MTNLNNEMIYNEMIKCIISRRTRKREFNTSEQISSQIKRA